VREQTLTASTHWSASVNSKKIIMLTVVMSGWLESSSRHVLDPPSSTALEPPSNTPLPPNTLKTTVRWDIPIGAVRASTSP